jgi:DNA-binding transcriptional LysR family regulator
MNLDELSGLDLNLLVVLAVVIEEVSVTAAARRLGRTQSAVSHALDRARTLLKDPIVARQGRGLVLTPRAVAIAEPLRRALADTGNLIRGDGSFSPESATNRFTLFASDYHQLALLPALSARLFRLAPRVVLHVKGPVRDVDRALGSGAGDLAFVLSVDAFPGLHARRLLSDRFVCLVRRGHPAVKGGFDLDMFVALPHVLIAPIGGRAGQVDDVLAKRSLARRVAVIVPHFSIAPRLLLGSDLVLTLPERVARDLATNAGLSVLEAPIAIPPIAVHMVWHERTHRDPAHGWIREMLTTIGKELEASEPIQAVPSNQRRRAK